MLDCKCLCSLFFSGKVAQLFREGWGGGPLKVGEVLLTKLRPGWRQVLSNCTLQ